MKYNRLITSLLATCMLANTVIPAFALDDVTIGEQNLDSSGQEATVPVTLDSEEAIFSVQVPSNLPIVVTSQGEVLTATNAKVVNNSAAPVEISDFEIESQSGWTFVDYDSFEKSDIGRDTKNAAFRVGAVKTTGDNATDFNEGSFNVMSAYDPEGENNIVDFSYDIKMPTMDSSINEQIANITFIVDWASGIIPVGYIIRVPEEITNEDGVYKLGYNQSVQLSAVEDYSLDSGVWSSSEPDVIFIDPESGYATAVGEGTCTISYTKGDIKGSLPFKVSYSKEVSSISVETQPDKLSYHVGDSFDSTGLTLRVQYSDGHSEVVSNGFSVPDGTNLQQGTSEVTVEYGGKSTKIAISIDPIGFNISISPSVEQSGSIYKLTYGEQYTLTANAVYMAIGEGSWSSDNSTIVSVDSSSGVINALKPGSTTVRYTNGDLEASINLEVQQSRVPQSVNVKTQPSKKVYWAGENFDSNGLVLEVTYTDGHTEDKSSGFSVVSGTNLSKGTQSVVVTYSESSQVVQCSVPITVKSTTVKSIAVQTPPSKTAYHVGDNFNSDGMTIKVTYDDEGTEIISSGFTVKGGENLQQSATYVTVEYSRGGGTASCTVPISIDPVGYNISISPSVSQSSRYYQLTYGAQYTLTAQAVYAANGIGTWASDNSGIVSVNTQSGVINAVSPGKTTVRYTNGSLNASINLEVLQSRVPQSITVKTNPSKLDYYVGETFDSTGLVLEVTYTDGHKETKDTGFAVVNGTNLQLGTKSVTISYTESDKVVQCNISITVKAKDSVFNKEKFKEVVGTNMYLKSITFGVEGGSNPTSISDDGNIVVAVDRGNYYIYNKSGGKIIFPSDSSYLITQKFEMSKLEFKPNSIDTSNVTNMECMIIDCIRITSLDISGFDTSNVTNMTRMFGGNAKLTSLDLSNFDTSNVTAMDGMFQSCKALTGLDLSSFDTSNVTTMPFMFYGCEALTGLDLSSFDTSNVTTMFSMFSDCGALAGLDLSSFDTSNVTTMNCMFQNCGALTKLDLSSFDTSKVATMNYMFQNCGALTKLDLSSFDTSNVIDTSYMFNNCKALTICYGRTQGDCNKFNSSPYKSGNVNFVVK